MNEKISSALKKLQWASEERQARAIRNSRHFEDFLRSVVALKSEIETLQVEKEFLKHMTENLVPQRISSGKSRFKFARYMNKNVPDQF